MEASKFFRQSGGVVIRLPSRRFLMRTSMRFRGDGPLLLVTMTLSIASGSSIAQEVPYKLLPDAPSPRYRISELPQRIVPNGYVATETRQIRPSFSTSLSARDKYVLAYHRIVSWPMPVKAVFVSGFELAAGTGPDLPTNGWGAFGLRVGYNAASIATTTFFNTAFVPALVHQDPRYFALGQGSAKARILWAVKSEFVGSSDEGVAMPNYGNLVGFALASVARNAYSPHASRGVENTAKSYAIKIGVSTGMNIGREFGLFDHVKALVRHSKKANP